MTSNPEPTRAQVDAAAAGLCKSHHALVFRDRGNHETRAELIAAMTSIRRQCRTCDFPEVDR